MQLKLLRTQKQGMMGKVKFQLYAATLFTSAEQEAIKRFRLAGEVVYAKNKVEVKTDSPLAAIGSIAAAAAFNKRLTVADLAKGITIECNDITEMLTIEDQIKQACDVLVSILNAAHSFNGEEIIDFEGMAA